MAKTTSSINKMENPDGNEKGKIYVQSQLILWLSMISYLKFCRIEEYLRLNKYINIFVLYCDSHAPTLIC